MEGHYCVALNDPSDTVTFVLRSREAKPVRPVAVIRTMYVSVGNLGPLFVPYYPSLKAPENYAAAVIHRFGCRMPEPTSEIKMFYTFFCSVVTRLTPIVDGDILEFETWLSRCGYSAGRRKYLLELRKKMLEMPKRVKDVEAFVKWEGYTKAKHARGICSYSDHSKVLLGPTIHATDKSTFRQLEKYFVKGKNPREWPALLAEKFGGIRVNCTDFTSFEAHHHGYMSRCVYFWLSHMMRNLTGASQLRALTKRMVLGRNHITFGEAMAGVDNRLMSGAMWTSSANGMLNLHVMAYLTLRTKFPGLGPEELATKLDEFNGLVEGDDGICEYADIKQELIDSLGLKLEMEDKPTFEEAGFCSIYCDAKSLSNVRDPYKTLRSFFVIPPALAAARDGRVLAYLRAKALSYKHLYPDAPVVGAMMDWVLRETAHVSHKDALKYFTAYERQNMSDDILRAGGHKRPASPASTSRAIVEKVFGMSSADQIAYEIEFQRARGRLVKLHLQHLFTTDDWCHAREFVQPLQNRLWMREPDVPEIIVDILRDGLHAPTTRKMAMLDLEFERADKGVDPLV